MPSSRRQIKQASRDFTAYLIGEIRKGRGEVRERSLNAEELKQFAGAKMKEVNQYIEQEVMETLPPEYEVPKERILKMRWVLTWKDDPTAPEGRKAKGRIVILGYQDPDLTERPRSAPTSTRTARMIFLTVVAYLKMTVWRADAKTAFLQGKEIERYIFCIPVPELAAALNISPGTAVKLRKSAYGMVDAPLEWYLTVVGRLVDLRWVRIESDPCMFLFCDENSQGHWRVVALAVWHVDDFEFGGREQDPRWQEAKSKVESCYPMDR